MGGCSSIMAVEVQKSRDVERLVQADRARQAQTVRILLLGAGESGKSTILKQLRVLYGSGFTDADRAAFAPIVFANLIAGVKALVGHARDTGAGFDEATQRAALLIEGLPGESVVTEAVGAAIATLWASAPIQAAWAARAQFQVGDCVAAFCGKVAEVSAPGYVPSVDDVLLARARTSGIVEEAFVIDGVEFTIVDVGGQRTERKKWIHCFEGVTAVVFVAAISEYDQALAEDNVTNRLQEALDLFAEVVNAKWFERSSVVLFLNKRDLFEAKIATVDLRHDGADGRPARFADYEGARGDAAAALQYITRRFLAIPKAGREVFHHVTCATDTGNVRVVFEACKDAILRENLVATGLDAGGGAP